MARVRFYVDGFNLYYGMLKGNPRCRWVDLQALATALRPGDAVDLVRYFTARVRPVPDPGAVGRQKLLLAAFSSRPKIRVHFGRFRTHEKAMPLVYPLPGGPATAQVFKTEEKGSDVNLATFLLLDGMDNHYEEAVVISDDSDLVEPIAQATTRFGPVHVLSPRGHIIDSATGALVVPAEMGGAGASWSPLPLATVAACRLPSPIRLPSGRQIECPPSWR